MTWKPSDAPQDRENDGIKRQPHGVEPPYAFANGIPAEVWSNEELKHQGRLRQDANPWEAKDLIGR